MSWKKWKSTITGAGAGALAGFATGGIAGAVIGAGAGGYLGYSTDAQNRANQKAVDRANAYDLYTWDLANQYNDPKAQMQRLAAAGLNPNLVYGSGSVTGNTTGTAGSNGVASQEAFNAIGKGLPLAQGLANLRNTNTQNELLKYQQGQTEAQTAYVKAQTRDLNNFLDGNGPSTYEPIVAKNVDALSNRYVDKGKKLYSYLTRPSTSSDRNYFREGAEWLGDTAWAVKNWFSERQANLPWNRR